MSKPNINVTPLIDVLLVLLIIFMVVAPLKPAAFKTRIPAEPPDRPNTVTNTASLIVVVSKNSSLQLNGQNNLGTTQEPGPLTELLRTTFAERAANGSVSHNFGDDSERPFSDRAERTVFIKAPRELPYGSVARVVDAVKLAGAYPISLQIDRLD